MTHLVLFLTLFMSQFQVNSTIEGDLRGAWRSEEGVMIFAEDYFAYTIFTAKEFKHTYGGSWKTEGNSLIMNYEFNTEHPEKVGTTVNMTMQFDGNTVKLNDFPFQRIDDGSPGKLEGAWLFSNRQRNGEFGSPRAQNLPRKTMKLLSGTRFQWIAYNVDTKEFMGSGGGTYTTVDGKYTENIDFFSRDNTRVGASLQFDFERKESNWHHKGFSSKGDPMYEIWSLRKE